MKRLIAETVREQLEKNKSPQKASVTFELYQKPESRTMNHEVFFLQEELRERLEKTFHKLGFRVFLSEDLNKELLDSKMFGSLRADFDLSDQKLVKWVASEWDGNLLESSLMNSEILESKDSLEFLTKTKIICAIGDILMPYPIEPFEPYSNIGTPEEFLSDVEDLVSE